MKLPHAESGIVDISKLRDYCLDPQHSRGKHKARVFRSAIGVTQDDAGELKEKIESRILNSDGLVGEGDPNGRRYIVDFGIEGAGQSAHGSVAPYKPSRGRNSAPLFRLNT